MKNQANVVIKKGRHSRGMLSGIFRVLSLYVNQAKCLFVNNLYVEDPRVLRTAKSGMTTNLMSGSHLTYKDALNKVYRLGVSPTGAASKPEDIRCKAGKLSGLATIYKGSSGFTLIELLVVVLIIGILAAVAVPQYQKAVLKSRFATIKDMTRSLAQAEEIYYLANGEYITNLEALDITLPPGNPDHEISTGTLAQRLWEWGKCVITKTYVACEIQKNSAPILGYQIYLNNSGNPQTWCVAYSGDLNSPSNKICKDETGKTQPKNSASSSTFKVWVY